MMRVMRAVSGTLLDGRQMAPSRAFSKVDLPAYSIQSCHDHDMVLNNVTTVLRASSLFTVAYILGRCPHFKSQW